MTVAPPIRGDADDTRTRIEALSERVDAGFKSVHARVSDGEHRSERRATESLSRFDRHTKEDERRFDSIEKSLSEMRKDSKEMRAELRVEIAGVSTETRAQTAKLDALLLKDAGQTGKIAGAVAATMTVLGAVAWFIEHFFLTAH